MKQPKPHAYYDAAYESNPHWKAFLKRSKLIAMSKLAEQEGWQKDGTYWRNPHKGLTLQELPIYREGIVLRELFQGK